MADEPLIAKLNGVDLAYRSWGLEEGVPVVLVHGFASNMRVNWMLTSWVTTLENAGKRLIAFDNRGHGGSSKFYDPGEYGPDIFAADLVGLLDHLEIEKADLVGYSMGARIAFATAAWHPNRVNRICLCGMGERIFGGRGNDEPIAQALEAPDAATVTDPTARLFRTFAERTGSDLKALAACIRPSRVKLTPAMAQSVKAPTLVAVGGDDDVAGPAEPLARMLPNGRAFTVPGRDHMKSTGDPAIKKAVCEFLA